MNLTLIWSAFDTIPQQYEELGGGSNLTTKVLENTHQKNYGAAFKHNKQKRFIYSKTEYLELNLGVFKLFNNVDLNCWLTIKLFMKHHQP